MLEDNPNSKKYGKHIRMQGILICNLVFIAIPCKTFTPVYVFRLVHVSVSLEFRHRFAFWLDYFLWEALEDLFWRKIVTNCNIHKTSIHTFRITYLGEVSIILKERFCSVHIVMHVKATLSEKKSLILSVKWHLILYCKQNVKDIYTVSQFFGLNINWNDNLVTLYTFVFVGALFVPFKCILKLTIKPHVTILERR